MVFKVYYQETIEEVPVREETKAMYVEAETEEQVRRSLKNTNYNIEFVTPLSDAALAYEKENNEDFRVEKA
ncbi:DNA-dependent RNA polymerase subunit epsilon [Salisediminibacterium halotolerans]|uniref:DNA-dependent RNA polymerase subunit epsilon n=1 Tax=Salisediminibacterium halotolerans TaxID=517425 RepID=UPI000EADD51A|nr:RNA polymerase epsilon subunit [Salisediminibacterium halotolerans]RLJ74365.1 DNA-dependent RNA polymerase auxiliary subunit epsilon [Actinophytocola xinjiangensis]RPE87542.1 DNA-dependent RNA polymerase auxiliary subunit epsilon [Salisediminibacterium halotolerans]TWG35202.1 DNA-dependent RNA polymerase auxiliary subunit epsilon [Salisediminibacterium halotolerans]GEL08166.1 UPF0356 protein [Salisediminibacterium halotolerans]